jgi:chromosome segregation ATPase
MFGLVLCGAGLGGFGVETCYRLSPRQKRLKNLEAEEERLKQRKAALENDYWQHVKEKEAELEGKRKEYKRELDALRGKHQAYRAFIGHLKQDIGKAIAALEKEENPGHALRVLKKAKRRKVGRN